MRRLTLAALLLVASKISAATVVAQNDQDFDHHSHWRRRLQEDTASYIHTDLFTTSPAAHVIGPTSFPHPGALASSQCAPGETIVPAITPVLGAHRPHVDAVLAYAAEYPLTNYILFVQTLRAANFTGDIVLAVHEIDLRRPEVKAYLSHDAGIVVYTPNQVCFNAEQEAVESAKGGIRTCQCHHLWGCQATSGGPVRAVPDPRPQRTIANTRYELYWIMASNYHVDSWMLLVDARDTIFQANPFQHVPRRTDPTGQSGVLYFFGENADATRIGQSKSNNKWIRSAYGDIVGDALLEKPTICSGATMGEQVALSQYLRAMVSEADETGTVLMGSDQGFHNRLYYSGKLLNVHAIHDIVVFDQGTGVVNNMGALRTKALPEWGNGHIVRRIEEHDAGHDNVRYIVLNWDGTPSPVVHQFDRHRELSEYFFKRRGGDMEAAWNKLQQGQPAAAAAQ